MREKYILFNNFLSADFNETQVHVESTFTNRTYLSSLYQLMGMYPEDFPALDDYRYFEIASDDAKDENYLSNNQILASNEVTRKLVNGNTFVVTRNPEEEDLLLHTDSENCPRYGFVQDLARESTQFNLINGYFTFNYLSQIRQLVSLNITTAKEMQSVCAYIQWATLANLTLRFTPSEDDMNVCMAMGDAQQYLVSYGLDEMWEVSSYEFLNKLIELTTSPNKYAKKFIHYAAHAETLSQFFDGIGLHRKGRSFPASAMIFEFVIKEEKVWVRLMYYNGET